MRIGFKRNLIKEVNKDKKRINLLKEQAEDIEYEELCD